jgi:hypothetical protein
MDGLLADLTGSLRLRCKFASFLAFSVPCQRHASSRAAIGMVLKGTETAGARFGGDGHFDATWL